MANFSISLPESLKPYIEEQTASNGFDSINAYIMHLVQQEEARSDSDKALEKLLLEGLDSGGPIEITNTWWQEKRRHLHQRLTNHDAQ